MSAAFAPALRDSFLPEPPRSKPPQRFTLDGSAALEYRLANLCQKVLAGVARIIPEYELQGIALGGGYGRGEGGVLATPAGDRPYNDLEFYVFVRGRPWFNERRYARFLHELSAELFPVAGIEVEFKITSPGTLGRCPQNLFYHDLLLGHRWLLGDDGLVAGCEHHLDAVTMPLSEATRLLMNRCSGLLFAREKLERQVFSAADADFVCRNIAKTQLALGDAVLIAFGKYHWSCLERGRALAALSSKVDLPWLAEARRCHAAGIEFKLQPYRSAQSREVLQAQYQQVSSLAWSTWLWLENRRLDCDFRSAIGYASSAVNKWPGGSAGRNWLANVRVFGPRALLLPPDRRHPRERILNALGLLLWARAGTGENIVPSIRRELMWFGPAGMIPAYRQRWSRAS